MPEYRVNEAAVQQARKLIDDGQVDVDTEWSDAAPSADDGNAEIAAHGYEGYGAWHLAVDPDASEETKGRYKFPYGDSSKVNRAASRPPVGARHELASGGGRRSFHCCNGWTTRAPEARSAHRLVTVPVARDTRTVAPDA